MFYKEENAFNTFPQDIQYNVFWRLVSKETPQSAFNFFFFNELELL